MSAALYQHLWSRGNRAISAHIFRNHAVDFHAFNNFSEQKLFFTSETARCRLIHDFGYFPLMDQSKNHVYANLDLSNSRYQRNFRHLFSELFRVGKQGTIVHFSPIYWALHYATLKHVSKHATGVLIWTEEYSNELCLMPISSMHAVQWSLFLKYSSFLMNHPQCPLYFTGIYQWESMMDAHLKIVYPPEDATSSFENEMIEHVIQCSMRQMAHFIQISKVFKDLE